MTYNGWTNWETWQILLWCDNDEFLYNQRLRWMGRQVHPLTAEDCETFFREMFPNGTPDMDHANDMNSVDWAEIADSLNAEIEMEQDQ